MRMQRRMQRVVYGTHGKLCTLDFFDRPSVDDFEALGDLRYTEDHIYRHARPFCAALRHVTHSVRTVRLHP